MARRPATANRGRVPAARNPFRSSVGFVAAALSTALLLESLSLLEGVRYMIDDAYRLTVHRDVTVGLRHPVSRRAAAERCGLDGVTMVEPQLLVPCDLTHGPHRRRVGVGGDRRRSGASTGRWTAAAGPSPPAALWQPQAGGDPAGAARRGIGVRALLAGRADEGASRAALCRCGGRRAALGGGGAPRADAPRAVRLGLREELRVEVTEGPSERDRVVVTPEASMTEGERVVENRGQSPDSDSIR